MNKISKNLQWPLANLENPAIKYRAFGENYSHQNGEMAEWSNALVLKTSERASVPRVRIPVSPPFAFPNKFLTH